MRHAKRNSERGMTLIEIMIVITILGMVAAAVTVAVIPIYKDAQVQTAMTDLRSLGNAADLYYNKTGAYPSNDEGFAAMIEAGVLKKSQKLTDPWGQPYVYRVPPQKNPDGPDIGSYGADRQPGGHGYGTDLYLGALENAGKNS